MTVEIKGEIKLIGELQTFDSGFTKIQVVVTEDGQYPTDIPIDFLKDKTDYLQNFSVGDIVVVSANLRGSEYNGKYYIGLTAWRIQRESAQHNNTATTQTSPMEYPQANQTNSFVDNIDHDMSDPPF
jgi:hypothetical protein